MSGEGQSRAPFECVCGFTAGTSFAWEKHLGLRNTPYSTVRHMRVTRDIKDTPQSRDAGDAEIGSSGRPLPEQRLSFPTPKALFPQTPTKGEMLSQFRASQPSPYGTPTGGAYSHSSSLQSSIAKEGIRLEEAARRGDMDRVARLAVEMLRLAQQGDSQAVLDMVSSSSQGAGGSSSGGKSSGVDNLSRSLAGLSVVSSPQPNIKFSAHISAVHQTKGGISIEQVPTGLRDTYAPEAPGRRDAARLLSMTEPLLDTARQNQNGPMMFGVDPGVVKRTLIAVAQHATRITSKESRVLEINSPCYVLGDIHGNLVDLQFFRKTLWPAGPEVTAGDFLFLGDFVDRGKDSIGVIAYIMAMKILNPNKWWLIRGNHETREVNGNIEHYQEGSFLNQCLVIFGENDGYAVWEAVNNFFDTLPLAASIDKTIFCVHGGIPRELCVKGSSLDIVRQQECPMRCVHSNEMVYDMLWSDPSSPEQERSPDLDSNGFGLSARGCTCFGERSIDMFLDLHGFKHVFRGHEAQQSGVGVSKGARLTTIFSTSKDHFGADIVSTCGCVLVDHDYIHPIVRALPQAAHSPSGLSPTYADQSIEASEASVAHEPGSPQSPNGASRGYLDGDLVDHSGPYTSGGGRSGVYSSSASGMSMNSSGHMWGERIGDVGEVAPPPRRSAWEERDNQGRNYASMQRPPMQQWLGAGR